MPALKYNNSEGTTGPNDAYDGACTSADGQALQDGREKIMTKLTGSGIRGTLRKEWWWD